MKLWIRDGTWRDMTGRDGTTDDGRWKDRREGWNIYVDTIFIPNSANILALMSRHLLLKTFAENLYEKSFLFPGKFKGAVSPQ